MSDTTKKKADEVEVAKPQTVLGGDTDHTRLASAESDEAELKAKVKAMVTAKFGGDYKRAFDHYDADHDGGISQGELKSMLSEAGVGNVVTRGTWASKIIEKMDSDGDGKIQWGEFESQLAATA